VIKGDDRSFCKGREDLATHTGNMLIETMVALHQVDAAAAGLGDFGRPDGFIERGIKGWRTRADRLQPQGDMKRLADEIGDWLGRQTIQSRAPTLLHCDLKLDNVILDPGTLAPRAIVDWDMGTRGDPLFDLATMMSYWSEAGDPQCMHDLAQMPTAAPGFQSRTDIVKLYAQTTGRDVSDYPVLQILCMFKLATVIHQLYATYGQGPKGRPEYTGFKMLAHDLYAFTHATMADVD